MLSDFILQTAKIVNEKSNMEKHGYIKHGLALLGTSLPILIFLELNTIVTVIWRIVLIIAIHILLDYVKEKLNEKISGSEHIRQYRLILFISDQFLHIALIILFTNGLVLNFNSINGYFLNFVLINGGINYDELKKVFVIGYIAFSGAYLIPLLFDIIYVKVDDYGKILNDKLKEGLNTNEFGFIDEVKTGKWIGILERILILAFLYTNQLSSIGFIIAMKSLARFKMMDNKIFSEYYLLGTFISMVYAFTGFSLLNAIL